MAPSQCLGHKTSRYDACNVARRGTSLEERAVCVCRRGFCRRGPFGKAGVVLELELSEKKQTNSCCDRRNFNRPAEGLTLFRLKADLISFNCLRSQCVNVARIS